MCLSRSFAIISLQHRTVRHDISRLLFSCFTSIYNSSSPQKSLYVVLWRVPNTHANLYLHILSPHFRLIHNAFLSHNIGVLITFLQSRLFSGNCISNSSRRRHVTRRISRSAKLEIGSTQISDCRSSMDSYIAGMGPSHAYEQDF